MDDYIVIAEHGVSCVIKHFDPIKLNYRQETEICVKIIKHATGKYEVIYKDWNNTPWDSRTKFYVGIPCLGDIRDDIQHFYMAECINVQDIMVLLDEACGISRPDYISKRMAQIARNSWYGLGPVYANIRDIFSDSVFDKIYIECKTTAKDKYRGRDLLPEISEVIFNKPATIVKWADGTKTIVKVQGKERYNKEKGLAMAIAKRAMGNSTYYYTIMKRYLEDKK